MCVCVSSFAVRFQSDRHSLARCGVPPVRWPRSPTPRRGPASRDGGGGGDGAGGDVSASSSRVCRRVTSRSSAARRSCTSPPTSGTDGGGGGALPLERPVRVAAQPRPQQLTRVLPSRTRARPRRQHVSRRDPPPPPPRRDQQRREAPSGIGVGIGHLQRRRYVHVLAPGRRASSEHCAPRRRRRGAARCCAAQRSVDVARRDDKRHVG